ncbi:hypothetical protein ACFQJ7_10200 [Halovenus rubra]|uniref:Uncharacterized protein n=2 Tax=Halovenus rubra TaxID=869890 RepID=A0ACC7DVG8_9EURY|nr:hypothetical protein [Halovenus rubra]
MGEFSAANRGVTPVVSKTLAIGLTVLYIAGMTTVLFGGVVPEYQNRTGAELGERVLATAAGELERAPPAVPGTVKRQTTVMLPKTIANEEYRLVLSNGTNSLRLDHSNPAIETKTQLSLPPSVTPQNNSVNAGTFVITVSGQSANRKLSIKEEQS